MKFLPRFVRAIVAPVLLGALEAAHAAPAEILVDPTRPPSAATSAPGEGKNTQSRTLQSVLIAPGRSVAVIDGALVRVGSRLGDAEVVKIDESGVILRGSGGTETLKLFPVAKTPAPPASRRKSIDERAK